MQDRRESRNVTEFHFCDEKATENPADSNVPIETHAQFYYPPELAPSQELIKSSNSQRIKEYFYEKKRDLYGFTCYEDDENLSATECSFHLVSFAKCVSEFFDINYIVKDRVNKKEYNNSYHYADGDPHFFHIIDGRIEIIKIDEIENFKKTVKKIMVEENYEYLQRPLTKVQLDDLISSAKQKTSVESKKLPTTLMQSLFPREKAKNPDENQSLIRSDIGKYTSMK